MSNEAQEPLEGLGLLVVDMQEGFLKAIPASERLQKRVEFVVRAAQLLSIPTFFTEQVPEKLGATLPALIEAAGGDVPVFPKTAFSAFGADGLPETLRKMDIEHLLLCGIETPICIYQTVLEGQQEECGMTLLTDAIGHRREADAQYALRAMDTAGAHLLPSETVFYSMLGDAGHPSFRDFSKLVKEFSAD